MDRAPAADHRGVLHRNPLPLIIVIVLWSIVVLWPGRIPTFLLRARWSNKLMSRTRFGIGLTIYLALAIVWYAG
jgi:hypothetical protein